jgi:leader peptidase (prepilin peptidase)/N-methyltransferase
MDFAISSFHLWACVAGGTLAMYASERALVWDQASADPKASTTHPHLAFDHGAVRLIGTAGLAIVVALCVSRASSGVGALRTGIFLSGLAYLAIIDLRTMLVPVYPAVFLSVAGIGFHLREGVADALNAAAVAGAAGAAFIGLGWAYARLRGRVGLGSGDALVAASIAAWLGVDATAWAVVAGGLVTLGAVAVRSRHALTQTDAPMPLVPGLTVAVFGALLIGAVQI